MVEGSCLAEGICVAGWIFGLPGFLHPFLAFTCAFGGLPGFLLLFALPACVVDPASPPRPFALICKYL